MGAHGVDSRRMGRRRRTRRDAEQALGLVDRLAKQAWQGQAGNRRAQRTKHGDANPAGRGAQRGADDAAQYARHRLDVDRRRNIAQRRARRRRIGNGHQKIRGR